jgi:ferredoxin-NADP reductase
VWGGKIGSHLQIRVFWERGPNFDTPQDFKPGQYFWVTLLNPPHEDDKGPRRHISVVTSPNERGVLVSARACATASMSTVSLSPFLGV